jgi:hypothetical protein
VQRDEEQLPHQLDNEVDENLHQLPILLGRSR